jgi:hypothetical protein
MLSSSTGSCTIDQDYIPNRASLPDLLERCGWLILSHTEETTLDETNSGSGLIYPISTAVQTSALLDHITLRGRPIARSDTHSLTHPSRAASAFRRIAARVVVGVIASGSILTWRIAGLPDASARSNAGANSAVISTVSPCPPNARA